MESPPSIHLHIDRVILDGLPFTSTDSAPIRATLEAELIRIIGGTFQGIPTTSVALDLIPAGSIALNSASDATTFSCGVATTLGLSLSQTSAALTPNLAR